MAKSAKKITALGLGPDAFQETRIRPAQKDEHAHTHVDEYVQTHEDVHTDTHTHKPVYEHTHTHIDEHSQTHEDVHTGTHTQDSVQEAAPVQKPKKREQKPAEPTTPERVSMMLHEPVAKMKKERRVQWLTYDSLIQRIDAYAQERGVSRADVLEAGMDKFLSDLGR